ncbi:MAG: HDOD domain-containing protein [Armatimonadetes bacterium]|nr:HDOD domain-containing protein [Armatimonadota bacterium]MCA1996425.1 HDOD domain-containing protein [Armatimonadota bacterium]
MALAPRLAENPALDRLLQQVTELAVLPHVVFKVLELSGNEDYPTATMEQAITVDPGFSSRLLRVANSSYYALPRKVQSIREAITCLGFRAVRQLAMTVGVFDVFIGKNDADSLRRRAWWRHAVDTAVCCRWLASKKPVCKPDEAYTAGLLHTIGKSLLDRFGQGQYRFVEELVARGAPVLGAERAVFGCDHIEAGVAAARKWGFPESLQSSMQYLLEPGAEDPHANERAVVAICSLLAEYAVSGMPDGGTEAEVLPSWALLRLGCSKDDADDLVAGATEAIASAAALRM